MSAMTALAALPAATDALELAERQGFDVRNVENLREHCALTLRHWIGSLGTNHDEAAAEAGEPTWRAWHLAFAGAALSFENGEPGLLQALLVRPRADGSAEVPPGCWNWYCRGHSGLPDYSGARGRHA
jgi:hypothetical protein